ncbi:MAG: hypothetical protein IPK97_05190 [Ahniella sp.]|nr:hypothetical protein [Ahniella sp.]
MGFTNENSDENRGQDQPAENHVHSGLFDPSVARLKIVVIWERVQTLHFGALGKLGQFEPGSIADGGNIVAFTSGAFNLVPGDFDDGLDFSYAMIRDRQGNSTNWVVPPAVRTRSIGYPVLSRDAAFVVFVTGQANLVPSDTSSPDFFRMNLASGEIVRVNQPPAGGNSNAQVDTYARMTADGRFVAFASPGSDLVAGDTNGVSDIFVRDMNSNVIERVSVGSNGEQSLGQSFDPWISGDGRFVAFASLGTQLGMAPGILLNVFVRDRVSNTTTRVSVGVGGVDPNGTSGFGSKKATISDDGRWVTFGSEASNLVPGDTNGQTDIFLTDLTSGTTTRVSTGLSGEQLTLSTDHSAMSADGSRIIYIIRGGSPGDPLILFDRPSGLRIPLNLSVGGTAKWSTALSDDFRRRPVRNGARRRRHNSAGERRER